MPASSRSQAPDQELSADPAGSRGVPMLLGGDEFRRTQGGNNNAYCQDNEPVGLIGATLRNIRRFIGLPRA